MSAPHGFQPMPGAVEHSGAEDPDIATNNRCRDVGGTHYCAAGSLRLGFEGEDGSTNDTGVGLLFVTRRGGGGRPFGRPDAQGDARPICRAARDRRHGRGWRRQTGERRDRPCAGSR